MSLENAKSDTENLQNHITLIEGIFNALEKICEDCTDYLELDFNQKSIDQFQNNSHNHNHPFFNSNNLGPGGINGLNSLARRNSSRNSGYSQLANSMLNNLERQIPPFEDLTQAPLYQLLPLFIDYFSFPSPVVQAKAVACCNYFIISRTMLLVSLKLDLFISGIFNLISSQPSIDHGTDSVYENVQRQICKALVLLLEVQTEDLHQHLPGIVDYMLYQSSNLNKNVALEAREFWLALAEQRGGSVHVLLNKIETEADQILDENGLNSNNRFSKLIPILTMGMKYEENDPVLIKADAEEYDSMIPDKDSDVYRPGWKSKNKSVKVSSILHGGYSRLFEKKNWGFRDLLGLFWRAHTFQTFVQPTRRMHKILRHIQNINLDIKYILSKHIL